MELKKICHVFYLNKLLEFGKYKANLPILSMCLRNKSRYNLAKYYFKKWELFVECRKKHDFSLHSEDLTIVDFYNFLVKYEG